MAGNTSSQTYTVGTTAVQILPPSDWRKAIVVCAPVAGRITVGPNSDIKDGLGMVVQQGDPPLKISSLEYG